jgi:hypothetical protein
VPKIRQAFSLRLPVGRFPWLGRPNILMQYGNVARRLKTCFILGTGYATCGG